MIKGGGSFDGVVFCLCHSGLFFKVEQVDLPGQAEVGLELADAVHAGVRATEVEADVAVAQGIILETEAFEVYFLARGYVLVVGFRVGQLGLVEVIACLGEHDPFLADVDADAVDGSDVLAEETFLLEGGTVGDIQIHLHTVELQLVAQTDVVDELALFIFDHIHRIGGLEDAEVTVPH